MIAGQIVLGGSQSLLLTACLQKLTAWQKLNNLAIPVPRSSFGCSILIWRFNVMDMDNQSHLTVELEYPHFSPHWWYLSSAACCVSHMKGIVTGEREARRLDGRCSRDRAGKSFSQFKLTFRHSSAFLSVIKFYSIFPPLVRKTCCTFHTADFKLLTSLWWLKASNIGLCSETY